MKTYNLGDVCKIIKGTTGIKKAIPGNYPLVVTAQDRLTHNEYQFDTDAVCIPLVSSTGHGHASINRIHFQSGKFALGSILVAVIPNDTKTLSAKFLHIYLSYYKDSLLVPLMKGGVNVSLSLDKLKGVEIRVPSIEKQREVIAIADTLSEIEEELKASQSETKTLMQSIMKKVFS